MLLALLELLVPAGATALLGLEPALLLLAAGPVALALVALLARPVALLVGLLAAGGHPLLAAHLLAALAAAGRPLVSLLAAVVLAALLARP